MKSLCIKLILFTAFAVTGDLSSIAQTPEQLNQKSSAYVFLGEEDAALLNLKNDEPLISSAGTQSILQNVLQFLKIAGKSLITGGILTILFIYILLMLIIFLRVSFADIREWKFII